MFAPRGDAQERAGPASRGRGGAGLGTEAASIVRAASEGRAAHAPQADDRGGQPQVVSGSRRRGSPSAGVAAPGDAQRTPLCQRGNPPRAASFDYNTICGVASIVQRRRYDGRKGAWARRSGPSGANIAVRPRELMSYQLQGDHPGGRMRRMKRCIRFCGSTLDASSRRTRNELAPALRRRLLSGRVASAARTDRCRRWQRPRPRIA
jgi:hypothetical protein